MKWNEKIKSVGNFIHINMGNCKLTLQQIKLICLKKKFEKCTFSLLKIILHIHVF